MKVWLALWLTAFGFLGAAPAAEATGCTLGWEGTWYLCFEDSPTTAYICLIEHEPYCVPVDNHNLGVYDTLTTTHSTANCLLGQRNVTCLQLT